MKGITKRLVVYDVILGLIMLWALVSFVPNLFTGVDLLWTFLVLVAVALVGWQHVKKYINNEKWNAEMDINDIEFWFRQLHSVDKKRIKKENEKRVLPKV